MLQILFLRNETLDMMFWSVKSVLTIVFVKKENLKRGSLEGSYYYAKHRVRETHVTNPFFTKRNIGYDVFEWEEHIHICFSKKRLPQTGEHRRVKPLCVRSRKGNACYKSIFYKTKHWI